MRGAGNAAPIYSNSPNLSQTLTIPQVAMKKRKFSRLESLHRNADNEEEAQSGLSSMRSSAKVAPQGPKGASAASGTEEKKPSKKPPLPEVMPPSGRSSSAKAEGLG